MDYSKIIIPPGVAIITFVLSDTVFPEDITEKPLVSRKFLRLFKIDKKNPTADSLDKLNRRLLLRKVARVLQKRAFKVAVLAMFGSAALQHFNSEVVETLTNPVLKHLCSEEQKEHLKTICKMYQNLHLFEFSEQVQKSVITNELGYEQKVELLKIKLDCLLNGPCGGRKRFFIVSLLGLLISLTISGPGGLAMILQALYKLLLEGKISHALYKQIITALARNLGVPVEILENLES